MLHNASRGLSATAEFLVVIARQHSVRYCFSNSVRPSVRHVVILYLNECTYYQTFLSVRYDISWTQTPLNNFKGNPLSRGVKYLGWENFSTFDRNRRLSRKRYDIGPRLLRITASMKLWTAGFVSVPVWPSVTLKGVTQKGEKSPAHSSNYLVPFDLDRPNLAR